MGLLQSLEGQRKDGSTFPVDIGVSTIESNGRRLRVVFVADITQRRQLERAAQAHSEQVQALAARLLTAQEEERRRVSRELHDQICQQLASLAIDISGLAADPPSPEKAQEVLKELQTRVIHASEATRHIAYELHPSVLDDLGLVASLRALCGKFGEHEGISVHFHSGELPSVIPRETASCLYRVVQESLQNIARHSGAKRASVFISVKKNAVALSITDDGSGFELEEARGRGGLGLNWMVERTRLANGKLSIAARKGHGTKMSVAGPLQAGVV